MVDIVTCLTFWLFYQTGEKKVWLTIRKANFYVSLEAHFGSNTNNSSMVTNFGRGS